jgi:protein kinase C substrate 80K-H
VNQGSTSLGKFKSAQFGQLIHVDDGGDGTGQLQDVLEFSGGVKCWNGPERSAKVIVTCNTETKLVSVDEVATCVYRVQIESPAACPESEQSRQRRAEAGQKELGAAYAEVPVDHKEL